MKPSIGRIVHYSLSQQDAEAINRRRRDFHEGGGASEQRGFIGHVGNHAEEGDIYPAVVVRVWEESTITVNLQVFLDGNDAFWATSRAEGTEAGTWAWPERV
ncbi:hypothetical protein [Streptomyces wuyuanensis]|uniref:Uncharacterized protein n=1 Tax=Streptomyces wuyuanensis TaxID=1196353 RepID=A0A1G9W0R0_9ACTN|nr:hypothetical protein [Streptomyces wuyuanensis]SDM77645.1 hypothetical protein SAMN05444921_11363 [Streptomyces wuyuanensis]